MKSYTLLSVVLLALILLSFQGLAHVPLTAEGNGNISSAMHILDPGKSWAFYGSIGVQSAQFYSLEREEGERIYLSLLRSTDPKEMDFHPGMALLGPGIKTAGQMPEYVAIPQIPVDYGILTAASKSESNATYEPFGPSSYIELAEINLSSPKSGLYYVVVFNNNTPGHYSLAVGTREEFSFAERITTPLRLISVYLWEGQSLGMILIPYLAAEMIGIIVFWRGTRRTYYRLAGTLAGFLFMATSASVFTQGAFSLTRAPFGPEVYITLAIAVFHAILGVAGIRLANGQAGILQRTLLAITGTMALLAGSGLLIGPVLAIAASLLPAMRRMDTENSISR